MLTIQHLQHIYLGLFADEASAARAYDRSLVRLRGPHAATNSPLSEYARELEEHKEMTEAFAARQQQGSGERGPCLGRSVDGSGDGLGSEHWIKHGSEGVGDGS